MLNHADYLIETLEELQKHAKMKLKESRKLYRKAGRNARADYYGFGGEQYQIAEALENEARKDLEQIQRILADPRLNR